jgi:hypothetical protein
MRDKGSLKNKLYPRYELHLSDGDKFLLASKKRYGTVTGVWSENRIE